MGHTLEEPIAEPVAATPAVSGPRGARKGAHLVPYLTTIALSAFLLFQVQLILGKYLLPWFGGTPAVWTTCMLCFQVLLVLGYAYGHLLGNLRSWKMQGRVHAALLAVSVALVGLLWLKWGSPLAPGKEWRPGPGADPVVKILELLGVTVGLPFFLLSTTGPLLQKWLTSEGEDSPYRFYALSNAGSLLGLLSYPFLIEWTLSLKHQAWAWGCGYLAFAILGVAAARRYAGLQERQISPRLQVATEPGEPSPVDKGRYFLWLGLSACSTIMLLATTNLLCQDIAVIPLLWVAPLALYLLSFILSFSSNRWYQRKIYWPLYFAVLGGALKTAFNRAQGETALLVVLYCATLFIVCMVCHGELGRSKPEPRRLTPFYLMVAAGGALGGVFVALVAPHLFLGFWEFHVGLIGCGFLLAVACALSKPSENLGLGLWTVALTFFLLCRDVRALPALWMVPMVLYLLCSILSSGCNKGQRNVFWPLYFAVLGAATTSAFRGRRGETAFLVVLGCVAASIAGIVYSGELSGWYTRQKRRTGGSPLIALGGGLIGGLFGLATPDLAWARCYFVVILLGCTVLLAASYALRTRIQAVEPRLWMVALIFFLAFLVKQFGGFIPNFETWPVVNNEYYSGALWSCAYLGWWAIRKGVKREPEAPGELPISGKLVGCVLLLGMVVITASVETNRAEAVVYRERNFFGVISVVKNLDQVMILNGSTIHGFEFADPVRRRTPTSYYQEDSGIGRILSDYPRSANGGDPFRVGLIGMGAGTLAAYGRPGDIYKFYEIDPAVVALSKGTNPYFHFVQDSPARVDIALGDARLTLEKEAARGDLQKFDVLVVDAFSGDSIPMHLLTREVMGTYIKHLRGPDAVIAFQITNRYLVLDPVFAALAQAYGLSTAKVETKTSKWILLSANPEMLRMSRLAGVATPLSFERGPVLWTDDYSNLFQVLQRPRL
jgi:hypothetical protein